MFAVISSVSITAQVTTGEIAGRVVDGQSQPIAGVAVEATHVPSGTTYSATSDASGRFTLPGMRVGGPYTIKATSVGFNDQTREGIQLGLGSVATVNFTMSTSINVEVTVTDDEIFSEAKTGASTNVGSEVVTTLPTLNRRLNDFAKLTPSYSGGPFGGSVAGQDNRMNNITVDGSYFNNSFGLSGQPGERTEVSPISLDAIEEFQVNVAPFDVRQGNFVGAGINTVTKSGTNTYHGSGYYNFRNESFLGTKVGPTLLFNRGELDYKLWGLTFGGPLPFFNFGENDGPAFISGKNKLFFFFSYENEKTARPAHTFTARQAGQTQGGSISRVLQSDLDTLATYLKTNFGYDPGRYQNYASETPAEKYLFRTDYNINSTNRLTLRYMQLDSTTDRPISTSNSGGTAGFGRGSQGLTYLSFENSNYKILENIKSVVGEWTTSFGGRAANSLIVGFTKQDESRPNTTKLFPLVDIHDGSTGTLSASTAYTSFGYEPFTPQNTLKYDSFQIQDNFSLFRGPHTFQFGVSYEKYKSMNIFFPSSQSIYSYRSLADFYTDANAFLNNVPSTVTVARFNVRYANQPGLTTPVQPLRVQYLGLYAQDQWKVFDNFSFTYGLRMEAPFFAATGLRNPLVDTLTFRDNDGSNLKLQSEKLPDSNILWSPRVGFNWSPLKSEKLQIRGGLGMFTARPPYVWISNQIGNNGVLTSIQSLDATTIRRFNPNPTAYVPATVTGAPQAGQQDLNFTVPNYKFPQIWRTSFAADYKVPLGMVVGAEYIYTKDVNGTAYINANLSNPDSAFTGPDNRPRWVADTCPTVSGVQVRVNCDVIQAITLKNSSLGEAWNLAFTLEKRNSKGFYAKGGYAYGVSKNTVDASSTAGTSFSSINHRGNPNNPGLGFSSAYMGHRVFASASYYLEYFKFGATTFSAFWESRNQRNDSYRYSNDMNGDTIANDLLYIGRDASETTFVTNGAFTPAQQSAAWEAFIQQDKYLSANRGSYAVRNAALYPIVHNLDFSIAQDLFFNLFKAKHKFQFRADILNFGNLLNKNWGANYAAANNNFAPLAYAGVDGTGRPTFRLNTIGGQLLTSTYSRRNTSSADVYTIQLGVKYSF